MLQRNQRGRSQETTQKVRGRSDPNKLLMVKFTIVNNHGATAPHKASKFQDSGHTSVRCARDRTIVQRWCRARNRIQRAAELLSALLLPESPCRPGRFSCLV